MEKSSINFNVNCSSFTCTSKDNKHFLGRTYDDYGNIKTNKISLIPKNMDIRLNFLTQETIKTKYNIVGMDVAAFDTPFLTEGMNDQGLMISLLFFPHFAKYIERKSKYQVNPGLFPAFILGKCKNLDEVERLISKTNLVNELETGLDLPCHYLISDRSGESMVVEPLKNGLVVYRNEMGILTNSPDYKWQKINLTNYLGITNKSKPEQIINGVKFSEIGEGSGYLGMPGDYTPVSRFVRLAFSKNFMPIPKNEIQAINSMFNIFESVDVPKGAIYISEEQRSKFYEETLCTSVMCSESLKYYFSSSSNQRICCVDLNNIKDNNQIEKIDIPFKQDINFLN